MGLLRSDPLYDFSASFWENYEQGPRRLTPEEILRNKEIQGQIAEIQKTGATLEVELFGRRAASPVALASGPAPNATWLEFFSELGYDVLTHKTVRDRFWRGHPLPNLLNVEGDFVKGFSVTEDVSGTITNSLGMPSAEPVVWKREVQKVLEHCGDKFVAVSVTATVEKETKETELIEQFASLSKDVKKTGAHAVELNLSCPNVASGEGGEIYTKPKLCGRIVSAVRSQVGQAFPILLKSGFLEDYAPLVEETCDGRTGYVVINSIAAKIVDKDGSLPFESRGGKGGVAGAAIFDFTLKAIGNLKKVRRSGRDFKIFAVGGVTAPEKALELIRSGADVVELATGAILYPSIALDIKKALLKGGYGVR